MFRFRSLQPAYRKASKRFANYMRLELYLYVQKNILKAVTVAFWFLHSRHRSKSLAKEKLASGFSTLSGLGGTSRVHING
ncbi:hypothetical protein GCM10008119_11030 [Pedobacter mendelii]|uniref:Uncharacterized protein n=1 Tax=Pedobacter mendelii TaxID=1908240 RepID=A0ABQ2BHB9_9SPHI|nr:hypothetical protein GCM10008119_11030 [Pedobacter mendelii]